MTIHFGGDGRTRQGSISPIKKESRWGEREEIVKPNKQKCVHTNYKPHHMHTVAPKKDEARFNFFEASSAGFILHFNGR